MRVSSRLVQHAPIAGAKITEAFLVTTNDRIVLFADQKKKVA
jgi:hypothetical protein